MNISSKITFLAAVLLLGIFSCVKREFDEPPVIDESADLEVTHTIAELKSQHVFGEAAQISDEVIIKGVVISNDQAGNFFKVLIIEDETAGIEIQIDRVALQDDYPLGREVFVKAQGLFMGDNNGTIQLGASIDAVNDNRVTRIPDNLRQLYLFRGAKDQNISPNVTNIEALGTDQISTLVQLNDVQFIGGDVGTTLGDAVNQFSRNLTLEDCEGNTILIRTSGFADFANFEAPSGNGSITAVYSVFGEDKQLFIRDLDDIQFDGDRCGTGPIGGDLISIAEVRELYTGSTATLPEGIKIKGVIISDRVNSNITSRNMVIQEPNGEGITVRFVDSNSLALGDEVEINVSGVEISEFQGLLQLNNVPNNRANKLGTASITPEVLTIADINASFEDLESTLVTINNVTITKNGGNIYDGSCTLEDGTGSIVLFTQTYAAFANNTIPVGEVNLTGIVSQGGSQQAQQISIRNLNDIDGDGGNGGEINNINETFTGVPNDIDLNLQGWSNIAEIGSRVWRGRIFMDNGYAQATSFNSQDPVNVMWLISPEITIDQPKELTFESSMNFWVHDALEVFVSTDFTGNNLASANWTALEARIATDGDTPQQFVPSGSIDLSAYTGTIHIAFKYTGNNSSNTSTYRVDNIVVKNK